MLGLVKGNECFPSYNDLKCDIYSTFIKHSWPAGIKLDLTDDCQKLVVTEVRLEHNHATSKVVQFCYHSDIYV